LVRPDYSVLLNEEGGASDDNERGLNEEEVRLLCKSGGFWLWISICRRVDVDGIWLSMKVF
jgi:hypothetical protein